MSEMDSGLPVLAGNARSTGVYDGLFSARLYLLDPLWVMLAGFRK
jgi:hypothetical protein